MYGLNSLTFINSQVVFLYRNILNSVLNSQSRLLYKLDHHNNILTVNAVRSTGFKNTVFIGGNMNKLMDTSEVYRV